MKLNLFKVLFKSFSFCQAALLESLLRPAITCLLIAFPHSKYILFFFYSPFLDSFCSSACFGVPLTKLHPSPGHDGVPCICTTDTYLVPTCFVLPVGRQILVSPKAQCPAKCQPVSNPKKLWIFTFLTTDPLIQLSLPEELERNRSH